jgi:NAD(P)H-nitrite reductase large subunit
VITDPGELTLQTPESFFSRFRVEMKVRHEVLGIDPESKTVTVKNLDTGKVFDESYDKLLLAPGARPTMPRLTGVDIPNVFTLRTVEDHARDQNLILKTIAQSPPYWPAADLSVWNWLKTCAASAWM